tara:strand:+ start:488 stop:667 length:180 start_codon:yes stop_codon:yes gene_type:complete
MVDFTRFLEYGLDKSYAIDAQIYQIHHGEAKTLSTPSTIHQEAGGNQEKYVSQKHRRVW